MLYLLRLPNLHNAQEKICVVTIKVPIELEWFYELYYIGLGHTNC